MQWTNSSDATGCFLKGQISQRSSCYCGLRKERDRSRGTMTIDIVISSIDTTATMAIAASTAAVTASALREGKGVIIRDRSVEIAWRDC